MSLTAPGTTDQVAAPTANTSPRRERLGNVQQVLDTVNGQTVPERSPFVLLASDRLISWGWDRWQGKALVDHLGRDALQGCPTRDFKQAWITDPATGKARPKLYRVGTRALERCQYVVMTHPQRSAVLVVDLDRPGTPGGNTENLHPAAQDALNSLASRGYGPAWVGINPQSGKAQVLWLIDPVYTGQGQAKSRNVRLLSVVAAELNLLLGGDQAFSHRFSRWPLHVSENPTAYVWHCQHTEVIRLSDLLKEVRTLTGRTAPERPKDPQYESGRARIDAARKAADEARLFASLSAELGPGPQPDVIDGVKVLWIAPGRSARDETAFRHALATGHRLRAAGERLKDATIINAYERAYTVAQAVGADGREPDLPRMEDRLTMARRVRGYVTSGTNPTGDKGRSSRMSSAGRKALSTLGRRGAAVSNAKRWADKDSELAKRSLEPLKTATQKRVWTGEILESQVKEAILLKRVHTGVDPTTVELAEEFKVSVKRIQQLRQRLGLQARRGRPKKA